MTTKESIAIAKVTDVYNPSGDGNCGFRCLAMAMEKDQGKYRVIKDRMLEHLNANHHHYRQNGVFLDDDLKKLFAILRHQGACAGEPQLWFNSPDCAQLAADTFLRPIEVHSNQQSMIMLPLSNTTYSSYQPIILQLFGGHFYLVTLKRHKRKFPMVSPVYSPACRRMNINYQSRSFANDN
jgi:hypothetical protein